MLTLDPLFSAPLDAPAPEVLASPWMAAGVLAVAFSGGLVLWLMGRRLLRFGFVFLGMLLGAGAGYVAAIDLALTHEPLAGSLIGSVAGAMLGFVLFRVAVASSLSAILAIAMTLATSTAIRFEGVPHKQATPLATDQLLLDGVLLEDPDSPLMGPTDPEAETSPADADDPSGTLPGTDDLLEELRDRGAVFASTLVDEARHVWNAQPTSTRLALTFAAGSGVLIGLVIGLAAPKRAAAATTAFIGPAIWLPSGAMIVHLLDPGLSEALPTRPLTWVAIWAGTSLFGLGVQWTGSKPKTDTA